MSLPLLAMGAQAAGVVTDYLSRKKAKKYAKRAYRENAAIAQENMASAQEAFGAAEQNFAFNTQSLFEARDLEIQQLDVQMSEDQLISSQATLHATENLREILSTQRSIFAARGQAAGKGSARIMGPSSVSSYNMDQFARSINDSFKTYQNKSLQNLTMMNANIRHEELKFGLEAERRGLKSDLRNQQSQLRNQRTQLKGFRSATNSGFAQNLINQVSSSQIGNFLQNSMSKLGSSSMPKQLKTRDEAFAALKRLGR